MRAIHWLLMGLLCWPWLVWADSEHHDSEHYDSEHHDSEHHDSEHHSESSSSSCSAYKGSMTINELRVGASGTSSTSNQIELYNSANVAASVWKTWKLYVRYVKEGETKSFTYKLSSGFTAAGNFIYSSSRLYLINKNAYAIDVSLVDSSGKYIDAVATERSLKTAPSCLTKTIVDAGNTAGSSGDVYRSTDGGSWARSVKDGTGHTIGKSNVCTSTGSDLVVSHSVDYAQPILKTTTVTYTITVQNKSCSNTLNNIVITDTGLSASQFSGLVFSHDQGSSSHAGNVITWSIGTLAPGSSVTMTISGIPQQTGTLSAVAAVSTASSGLINTSDDTATASISVVDYNYVSFDESSDTITEGVVADYAALISSAVTSSKTITVNYTVSGTANSGDTNLSSSGSVTINPSSTVTPRQTSIDFTVTDDAMVEVTKTIVLTISSVTSGDSLVKLDSSHNSLTISLVDDDTSSATTTSTGSFNCVEVAQNQASGSLYTKLAGTAFNVDVVAMNADSSLNSSYAASSNQSVTLEWVDASSGGDCSTLPALNPAVSQTVTFSSANSGRKTVSAAINKAYSSLRCRVTDANQSPSVSSCSSDVFTVRPMAFTVSSTDANADSSGVSPSASPVLKAGNSFTLQATAVAGYGAIPLIDDSAVSAHVGSVSTGVLTGSFQSIDSSTGIATGSAFNYSEVGYFRLAANGVYDTSFTAVDANAGECSLDFSNTLNANGQYGCYIGSHQSAYFGRFIPDHFMVEAVSHGSFAHACSSFSYVGQTMHYATQHPTLKVIAYNANSAAGVTQNYSGNFARLSSSQFTMLNPSSDALQLGTQNTLLNLTRVAGTPSLVDNLDGSLSYVLGDDSVVYLRNANALVAPFSNSVALQFTQIVDSDAVAAAGLPMSLQPSGETIRYGRIYMANALGSELDTLPVTMRAEYYDGKNFITNSSDFCSVAFISITDTSATDSLQSSDTCVWDDNALSGASQCSATGGTSLSYREGSLLLAGNFNLNLKASHKTGALTVTATVDDWLKFDWLGSGVVNPSAEASFGVFNGHKKQIYLRELY